MKFKGNQPIRETIHPDPDQEPVLYPEPRKYPLDFETLEEADRIESDEGDPRDAEGGVPATPPESNLIPFHRPRKRRVPDHNM